MEALKASPASVMPRTHRLRKRHLLEPCALAWAYDERDNLSPAARSRRGAVVKVASASQPNDTGAGLELLRVNGIYGGLLKSRDDHRVVAVDGIGAWQPTDSGLMLASDGSVIDSICQLWVGCPPEEIPAAFSTFIDDIVSAIGTPSEDNGMADGSRTTLWRHQPADIEVYHFAERPRMRAMAQIGITWAEESDTP